MSKPIGFIGWRQRGTWTPNTDYRKNDAVIYDRSMFYAKEDHTSGEEFGEELWGIIADARGVEAIVNLAKEATQRAESASQSAEEEAEAAKQAAKSANEEAGKASEVTEIFSDHIKLSEDADYLYGIVDSEGNLLWGIKHDGSCFQPKGIPEETKKRLEEITGLETMENSDYAYAIVDAEGNILFALDRKGGSVVNSIKGVITVEQFDSNQYIYAVLDSAGNLLFGVRFDGTFCASKFDLPEDMKKQLQQANACSCEFDESDQEFIYKITDADGFIMFGIRWNGTIYQPKGIPEEQKKNAEYEKSIKKLQKDLNNFSGGTGDWSDLKSAHLPMPIVPARVEITATSIPTSKYIAVPGKLKFNDMMGNSFTKAILWNLQGNISSGFDKKNFSIDILNDAQDADDTFEVKFGNWVPQDSFHLKAYYSDFWKIRSLVPYRHAEEIALTRPYFKRRPWDIIKGGALQSIDEVLKGGIGEIDQDIDTGALGRPDGFPFMLYINGTPWGLYTWNLKKHKDNYCITKNDNDGLQLFFGDYMTGVFQHYNNNYWVLSNKDLRKLEGNGSVREIIINSYTSASGALLVMESKGVTGLQISITNSSNNYIYPVKYNGADVSETNTWEAGDCVSVKRAGTSTADYYWDVTFICKKWDEKKAYFANEYTYDEDTINFEANGKTSEITIRRLFRFVSTIVGYCYDDEGYPCTMVESAQSPAGPVVGSRIFTYRTMRPSYINWRSLEVRNPKKTICIAHDGLDEKGKEKFKLEYYDYDSPSDYAQTGYYEMTHEIISEDLVSQKDVTALKGTGEEEEFSKKEYTRSCNTRKTLETYSFVCPIMDMTIPEKNLQEWGFSSEAEAKKAIFAEHHDTDHNIDFFLVYNDCYYSDSITHNTLYTMYDGKKIFAGLYDTDISLGMDSTYVNSFGSVSGSVLAAGNTFVSYLWTYFKDEIKARWAELRKNGAISAEAMERLVWNMVDSIGAKAYAEELRLWSQPSYRNPVYWRMNAGALQIIGEGEDAYHGYNEDNNKEVENAETWESGKAYVVDNVVNYEGHSYSCTVAHTSSKDTRPDKAYTCGSPTSGGVFDSPRRIIEWYKKRLANLDTQFGFDSNTVSAASVESISNAEIDNIINKER